MRTEKVTDAATQNIQIFHTKFHSVIVSVWCTLMVRGVMDLVALWRYNYIREMWKADTVSRTVDFTL
jgi:hypothetical protein